MADPTTLLSLAARAEAGETGQRFTVEIIAAIVGAPAVQQSRINGRRCIYDHQGRLWSFAKKHAALSEVYRHDMDLAKSLDAQEALPGRIERVLHLPAATQWCAWTRDHAGHLKPHGQGPTEALARLSALLRALAAQEEPAGE